MAGDLGGGDRLAKITPVAALAPGRDDAELFYELGEPRRLAQLGQRRIPQVLVAARAGALERQLEVFEGEGLIAQVAGEDGPLAQRHPPPVAELSIRPLLELILRQVR